MVTFGSGATALYSQRGFGRLQLSLSYYLGYAMMRSATINL